RWHPGKQTMPFGQHRGRTLEDIARNDNGLRYLDWLSGQELYGPLRKNLTLYVTAEAIERDIDAVLPVPKDEHRYEGIGQWSTEKRFDTYHNRLRSRQKWINTTYKPTTQDETDERRRFSIEEPRDWRPQPFMASIGTIDLAERCKLAQAWNILTSLI